jgi:hypothetical protein
MEESVPGDEPAETPSRRTVSWGVAVLLGACIVLLVLLLLRQDAASPSYVGIASLDPSTWRRHADPDGWWLLRSPARWQVQLGSSDDGCGTQIVVSNFDDDLRHPELGPGRSTCLWDMRLLPANFAVVAIDVPRDVVPSQAISQTPPLSFDDGLRGSGAGRYGVPNGIFIPVWIDGGHRFIVRAWTGSSVSGHDRAIVKGIVESIRSAV